MEQEAESSLTEATSREATFRSESFGETLAFLSARIAETESAYQSELGPDGERLLALINQSA